MEAPNLRVHVLKSLCQASRVFPIHYTIDFGGNPLLEAISRQDLDEIGATISRDRSLLQNRFLGFKPIHFALGWPAGFRILLGYYDSAAINEPSLEGHSLLWYAANIDRCYHIDHSSSACTWAQEIVQVVLEADCALPFSVDLCDAFSDYSIDGGERLSAQDIPLFCYHLADRRRRLREYALNNLSTTEASRLGLHNSLLSDSKAAAQIGQQLQSIGVEIPSPLQIVVKDKAGLVPDSIYDWASRRWIRHIFDAGFTDCAKALTAFLRKPFFDKLGGIQILSDTEAMFQSVCDEDHRGFPCDCITVKTETHPTSPLHVIASLLAPLTEYFSKNSLESQTVLSLVNAVVQSEQIDECECPCSNGGCHPVSMVIKGFVSDLDNKGAFDEQDFVGCLRRFGELLCRASTSIRILENAMGCFVRGLTFEALEFRHNCCREDPFSVQLITDKEENEEANERLSEEQTTMGRILGEIYEGSGGIGNIEDLDHLWRKRMFDILNEEFYSSSCDELARIGVKVEPNLGPFPTTFDERAGFSKNLLWWIGKYPNNIDGSIGGNGWGDEGDEGDEDDEDDE